MAIYTGTFKNGGVAFDPACFSLKEWENPPLYQSITVAGEPVPDCTGTYIYAGQHNGLPYWQREDEAFILWADPANFQYYIATAIAAPPVNAWHAQAPLETVLLPKGTYAGDPTLTYQPLNSITITGASTSNIAGLYLHAGIHNGLPYWKRDDEAFVLFWFPPFEYWFIYTEFTDDFMICYLCPWLTGGRFLAVLDMDASTHANYTTLPPIEVLGTLNPDATGTYLHAGTYEANPYWTREDAAYSLWTDALTGTSHISVAPGDVAAGQWSSLLATQGPHESAAPYTGDLFAAAVISEPATHGGILRLRVHGRRAGSGTRPGYYEATPITPAGYYLQSPIQRVCRDTWGKLMRFYATFEPVASLRVNTEREAADVTNGPHPGETARYFQLLEPPFMSPWRWPESDWTLWWCALDSVWLLAQTYPDVPDAEDPYWYRYDVAWYGIYSPGESSEGTATVASATWDGKYFYVGPHDEFPMWYNSNRQAFIWWSAADELWYLATTYPDPPTGMDTFWFLDSFAPFGEFLQGGIAEGTAHVDSIS